VLLGTFKSYFQEKLRDYANTSIYTIWHQIRDYEALWRVSKILASYELKLNLVSQLTHLFP